MMKALWKKTAAGLFAGLAAGLCPAAETVLDRQGGWEVVQSAEGNRAALFLVQAGGGARTPLAEVEVPTATVTNTYWDEYAGWDESAGRPVGGVVTRVDAVAAEYRFRASVDDGRVYWEDRADGTARLWSAPCEAPERKTLLGEAPARARASAKASGGQDLVFDANGGKFEDGGNVMDGWNWDIFNDTDLYDFWYTDDYQFPTRAGHAFDGWYSAAAGGTRVDGEPVTSASRRTLYAHWAPTSGTSLAEAADCGKLAFTTEGDALWFGQQTTSHDGSDAARSGQLAPAHAWSGTSSMSATVDGPGTVSFWWKADGLRDYDPRRPTMLEFLVDGSSKASLKTGPQDWKQESFSIGEGTHVLTWKYQAGGDLWRSYYYGLDCGFVDQVEWKWQGNQTVTFDARGGTCATTTKTYAMWKPYGTLPDATQEGYAFEGWFTAATGGTRVTAGDTVPEQETRTLYAHWKPVQTVTFDANGGSCGTATAVYPLGETYGSLPAAARGEDIFLGWFTDAGVLVTAESPVEGGVRLTLHARWVKAVDGVGIAVTSVRQRFPWNGLVDIDYEVFCEDPDTEVWVVPEATDGEHGRALKMKTLSGDGVGGRIKAGRHRMTWDAKADNPGAHSSALTVKMKGAKSATQTISFASIGMPTWQDRVELSATASSGGAVTFEVVSGPGVVTGNVLTFTGGGTVEVRAVQAGDERWLPATATQTVVVAKVYYLVLDLSAGADASSYPVTELDAMPAGGFNTDEYKTTKLVLRRIEPGTFMMGGGYQVTLTKPYYMGVFEVTQKQWELVTGGKPSDYKGDERPVECVSWNRIRGDSGTFDWPNSTAVDENSFMGRLRARTGLEFDLPTEAQWEYACRAGTTTDLNNGKNLTNPWGRDSAMDEVGRYWDNRSDGKGGYSEHTTVGSYLPNAWGLYDMHGNVCEWCLDWYGSLTGGVTDPVGSSPGSCRVARGGSWNGLAYFCASSYRDDYNYPSSAHDYYGFRLVRTLSE